MKILNRASRAALDARDAYECRRDAYLTLGATHAEAVEAALHETEPVSAERLARLRARHTEPVALDLDLAGREAYEDAYRRRNEYPR